MSKKEKSFVTGSVTIKGTFSQLRDPVDKKAVRSRGPGQIGQSKPSATVRLGRIGTNELTKRLAMAARVLETGKGPAKGEDANLAKLQEARRELKELYDKYDLTTEAFQEQTTILEKLKAEREDILKSAFNENSGEVKSSEEEVKSDEGGSNTSLEEKLKEAADPVEASDPVEPEPETQKASKGAKKEAPAKE